MSEAQTELDNQRAADDVQERELITAAREARKTAERRNARRAARQAAQDRIALARSQRLIDLADEIHDAVNEDNEDNEDIEGL